MKKKTYLKDVNKYFLWTFFDHVIKIIQVSALWFVFSFPLLYTGFVLFYSRFYSPVFYIILLVIIFNSPVSLAAFNYMLQIVSQKFDAPGFYLFPKVYSPDQIKLSVFFRSMGSLFFTSIKLVLFLSVIYVLVTYNIYFYYKVIFPKARTIALLLMVIFFWLLIMIYFLNIYLIPILITKKVPFFKAFYQAFLLVIDNIFYTISISLLLFSLMIILIFTLAGFFALFFGIKAMLQLYAYLIIYQKYDDTMELTEERRTFRNIFQTPY